MPAGRLAICPPDFPSRLLRQTSDVQRQTQRPPLPDQRNAATQPTKDQELMSTMTPREIVHELDRHIIGQDDAKRAVAIALRNRWRRMQLPEELRNEITRMNVLINVRTAVGRYCL